MERIIITSQTVLKTTTCVNCGVIYAMPETLMNYHQLHGEIHYCPNGHGQSFTEPEVPKLEKELREQKNYLKNAKDMLDGALQDLNEKSKELKQVKKRIHAGTCPHCHRHFVNVERHMKSKH